MKKTNTTTKKRIEEYKTLNQNLTKYVKDSKKEYDTYLGNDIANYALQAAISTLKRIEKATADPQITRLLNGIREDVKKINNDFYSVAESKQGYRVTDGYDIFYIAYEYLLDQYIKGNTVDTEITVTLATKDKDGNRKTKTRTVFQWACIAVRRYIYKHGQTDYKRTYIEDLKQTDKDGNRETDIEVVDRIYLKAGKYYDIQNLTDLETTEKMLDVYYLLTDRQRIILHYRLQGLSITDIAKKLDVSQQAISKQLASVQQLVREKNPELVRQFKEKRIKA